MTLVEFLTARLDELEAIARAAAAATTHADGDGMHWRGSPDGDVYEGESSAYVATGPWGSDLGVTGLHIAANDPAHVLADIAAKRRIVERHSQVETGTIKDHGGEDEVTYCGHCGTDLDEGDCPDLLDLASIYSERPDYDPSWVLE